MQRFIPSLLLITLSVFSCGDDSQVLTPADTDRPRVSSISCFGRHPVSIADSVLLIFTEPIAPRTCNSSTISLGDEVPLRIRVNRDSVVVQSAGGFLYQTTYTMTVAGSITDLAGNRMDTNYAYSFVTQESPVGSKWNPVFTGVSFEAVAFSGTVYVAVGGGGKIARSLGGHHWELIDSPTTSRMRQIIWADSMFVVVEDHGKVHVSKDGLTWNSHEIPKSTPPPSIWLADIAHSGSVFVATDFQGRIFTSYNAIDWSISKQFERFDRFLVPVEWVGDYFVVGDWSSNTLLVSTDGWSWEEKMIQDPRTLGTASIAWSGKEIVIVPHNYQDFVLTGPSVDSLEIRQCPGGQNVVTWTGDMFVIGCDYGVIMTSPNGRNWTKQSEGGLSDFLSGACGDRYRKVIVGNQILVSD